MKENIEINADAIALRKYFGEDASSPIDIFTLISNSEDMTVVFYPMSNRMSGMCIRDESNKLIAINSSLTYGRQRFTVAHELCHLFYHTEFTKVVCAKDMELNKDPKEIEADQFATYFLAPYEALKEYINTKLKKCKGNLGIEDVVRIEQYFGMSRQATLKRLVNEAYLTKKEANTMMTNISQSAVKLGFDKQLYRASAQEKHYFTLGKYINSVEKLKQKDVISNGKYEEYLLSAFREDIVYGIEVESDGNYD